MLANKHSLIRYKTIDTCLQDRERRWTLEDLIKACSEVLYGYEGTKKKIGKRTIQADIQMMRSDKLGYNAPIKVVDRKYYTYDEPGYSITNIPLTNSDLKKLTEVTDILKQFKGFTHFSELSVMVQKLEDRIYANKEKRKAAIDIEKNENVKGLEYLELIYQSIHKKQVLEVLYQSFKAKRPGKIIFHPYLLKEYRNRWFVVGRKDVKQPVTTLALDRINEIEIKNETTFIEDKEFRPDDYYKNVIGVTVNSNRATNVHLFFNREHAPYIITKPLHHSQQIISETDEGVEIVIKVIPNFELEREILGFGENVKVLSPQKLQTRIKERLNQASHLYTVKSV